MKYRHRRVRDRLFQLPLKQRLLRRRVVAVVEEREPAGAAVEEAEEVLVLVVRAAADVAEPLQVVQRLNAVLRSGAREAIRRNLRASPG
jgi:hypothetical protein